VSVDAGALATSHAATVVVVGAEPLQRPEPSV
jgi:hypothetical protein